MSLPHVPANGFAKLAIESSPGTALPMSSLYSVGPCQLPQMRSGSRVQEFYSIGYWAPIATKGGAVEETGSLRFWPEAGDTLGEYVLGLGQRYSAASGNYEKGALPSFTVAAGISEDMYTMQWGCRMEQLRMSCREREPLQCEARWRGIGSDWTDDYTTDTPQTFSTATPDLYMWYEGIVILQGTSGTTYLGTRLQGVDLTVRHQHGVTYPFGGVYYGVTRPRNPSSIRATVGNITGRLQTYAWLADDLDVACLPSMGTVVLYFISACTGKWLQITVGAGKWQWKYANSVSERQLRSYGSEFVAYDYQVLSGG